MEKGDFSDVRKHRELFVHPTAIFYDTITNGNEITLQEIERRAGGRISRNELTAQMALRGFERKYQTNPPRYVRRSWSTIEPYRQAQGCTIDDLKNALEFHNLKLDISWKNIISALGFHARREDVNRHMKALGYSFDRKRARWNKTENDS